MSAALKAAQAYAARKWNPLPLPFKSKIPQGTGWQKRVIRENDVAQFFNGTPQNVGVVLGPSSNGLTDIDLDCPEAITLAPQVLQKTDAIFGRASAPASHWLYYSKLAATSQNDKATIPFRDPTQPPNEAMLLEVRVGGEKGAQTVFPGSVHESDEEIRWYENGDPAKAYDDLLNRARLLASICLFARYWPGHGARHDAALSLGGFLARAGLTAPQVKYLVKAIAQTAGDSEYQDRKDTAEDAAQAFHAGKPARGYPQLAKAFGNEVAKQIAEWLDYRGSTSDNTDQFAVEAVDLWAKFDPPTLPRGLLPQVLEDFVFEQGMDMGCDMSGVALGVLVVCAAAITDRIKLQPKKNNTRWLESARLWGLLVGDVSAMRGRHWGKLSHPYATSTTQWRAKTRKP